MAKPEPEYEHRVVVREPDGKIRVATDPSDNPKAIGDHFRAMREGVKGDPEIGSVAIERRPVNPHPWETREIARNTPKPS